MYTTKSVSAVRRDDPTLRVLIWLARNIMPNWTRFSVRENGELSVQLAAVGDGLALEFPPLGDREWTASLYISLPTTTEG